MKDIIKKKWFMAIAVVIAAGSLFLVSFCISRNWTGKVAGKEDMQVAEQKKQEKEKFINKNIKDEKAKEIIKLQDKINEAERNGQDPDELIDQALRAYNYTEEYKRYIELPEEEKEQLEVIPREQKVDENHFEEIKKDQEENQNDNEKEVIPEKFDLRDKIDIKVENQEGFGLCWDFASNSVLETNLALTKGQNYDFSEIHVDYFTSKEMNSSALGSREVHNGGTFETWLKYVNEMGGLVLEDEFEYKDYPEEEYVNFYNSDKVDMQIAKIVQFPDFDESTVGEEKFKEYQDIVKKHIMNYGGLYTTIRHKSGVDYIYDSDKKNTINHAVCIIGWDDNFSKEYFRDENGKIPSKDGAYIVLNSHGENNQFGGYKYISYEDVHVNKEICGVVSTNPKDAVKLSSINNEAIEDAIRENCNYYTIEGEEYVSNYELEKIKSIDLSNKGIISIEGIKCFKNLRNINISNNQISDLSPLAELDGLMVVNAENNNIKEASVLEACPLLYSLNLSGNSDVTGYELCHNLEVLELKNCNLTSIEKINEIGALYSLNISNNKNINDIENLKFDYLLVLDMSNCDIKDIPEINGECIDTIVDLDLSYNNIDNLEPLKKLSVWQLDLSGNKNIKSYETLNTCDIKELVLKDCDVESLAKLPTENQGIFELNISDNDISSDFESLKTMKSLEIITMQNCNLKDISGINKLESVISLDLRDNPNVEGDIGGHNIKFLTLNDTEINHCIESLKLGNKTPITIVVYGTVSEEILEKLPDNIEVSATLIEKNFYIPNTDKVYLYSHELRKNNTKIVQINDSKYSKSIPEKIDISDVDSLIINCSYEKTKYNLVKNDSMKPIEMYVVKKPTIVVELDDSVTQKIMVEQKFENGIYVPVNNFDIWYDKGNVHEGSNIIRVFADGVTKYISVIVASDGKYITLKFEDKELYNRVVNICESNSRLYRIEKIIKDDDNKTIKITQAMKNELQNVGSIQAMFRIPYESLYDIKALCGLGINAITIEFSEDSSQDAKITQDDLDNFKMLFKTKRIGVYDYHDGTFKRDRIIDQDEYIVSYINYSHKVKYIGFEDEKMYNLVREKFSNLYVDYSECNMIGLTEEQLETINNGELTIPYEYMYDIKSFPDMRRITIELSGESKITEEDLALLEELTELNTIYVIDKSEEKNPEDMIVNQNKYNVYVNGELYQGKEEHEDNIDETYNNVINNVNVINNNVISNNVVCK